MCIYIKMTQKLSITSKSSSGICSGILCRKCTIASIICMTIFSFILFIIFWCTNIFQNTILSNLVIRNNSPAIDYFTNPPVRAVYKIHIFNYTNVDDVRTGEAKKFKVVDTGPYIYRETLTRVNQVFHPNGSVSFQEKRSFQWEGGSPDDEMVIVPNVPLLAAISTMKDHNFLVQIAFSTYLRTLKSKSFITIPAGEFLWGYDDEIFTLAKNFHALQGNIPADRFGVLAHKNGVSDKIITIHTGVDDMSKLAMIQRVDGQNKTKQFWDDERCDRIHGTQGFMFPPGKFDHPNSTIDVYSLDMCRTISLHYQGNGNSFGIPSLTFKPSPDIFTLSSSSKDYCYCPESEPGAKMSRQCPLAGTFNSTACSFNLPFLASYPHFYTGDKILTEKIDGLNPQAELHETSIELHPRLGVLIGGYSRIQINIEARRANSIPFLGPIEDGQILPLIWLEVGVDSIPEPMMTLFKHAYFTAATVEMVMKWGSIVGMVLSLCSLFYIKIKQRKARRAALKRNSSEMSQSKLLDATRFAYI